MFRRQRENKQAKTQQSGPMMAVGFKSVAKLVPQLVQSLPNEQDDQPLQAAGFTPLANFDFRNKRTKKVGSDGREIKPGSITLYNRQFRNLFQFGTFAYTVTNGIAGQTSFGSDHLLVVQKNPTRGYEELVKSEAQQNLPQAESKEKNKTHYANRVADLALGAGGLDYMRACFENANAESHAESGVLLVLGTQHPDGRDENLEPYTCRGYISPLEMAGNVHEYQMNREGIKAGLGSCLQVFHANMTGFEHQRLDSRDMERLYDVYSISMGKNRPLMIHCTDGMDRAGGVAFAFHLLHHWDRIFTGDDPTVLGNNIQREHEYMQQMRGPGFCTAHNSRLQGALQLAFMMKSVQVIRQLCESDPALGDKLKGKEYLQQLFILRVEEELSPTAQDSARNILIALLESRADIELSYFEQFAPGMQHPQASFWHIEKMLSSGERLSNDDQHEVLLERYNEIKRYFMETGFNNAYDDIATNELQMLEHKLSTHSIVRQINEVMESMNEVHVAKLNQIDLSAESGMRKIMIKLDSILHGNDPDNIKLNKAQALLAEVRAIDRIIRIERCLQENPSLNTRENIQYIIKLQKEIKTAIRTFNTLGITAANLGVIDKHLERLEKLQKKFDEALKVDNSKKQSPSEQEKTPTVALPKNPVVGRAKWSEKTSDSREGEQKIQAILALEKAVSDNSKTVFVVRISNETQIGKLVESAQIYAAHEGNIENRSGDQAPQTQHFVAEINGNVIEIEVTEFEAQFTVKCPDEETATVDAAIKTMTEMLPGHLYKSENFSIEDHTQLKEVETKYQAEQDRGDSALVY